MRKRVSISLLHLFIMEVFKETVEKFYRYDFFVIGF
jgi:hypothetical protein